MMMKVLVTACNGYVGEHCLSNLLHKGYFVRGTVRSNDKAGYIRNKYASFGHQLDLVIVDAIEKDDAFRAVAEGIDYILHVASPMPFHVKDLKKDLLEPAVKGTTNILQEAQRQPSVKRVVITSSFGTVFDISNPTRDISEASWNPITWEEAQNTTDPMTAYRASKKFAEKAAWDFVDTQKPHFDIVTIVAPMVYGPMLYEVTEKTLNESSSAIWKLVNAGKEAQVPPARSTIFVDVRDLAEAHVQAMEVEGAGSHRLFVLSGNLASPQASLDALRAVYPQFTHIPLGNPSKLASKPNLKIDTSLTDRVLQIAWTPFEKTITDLGMQLLELPRGSS